MKDSSSKRRELSFEDLDGAVEETRQLQSIGYVRNGNWTLGQICRHLRTVQDPSIDGYPKWMSLFAPIRPVIKLLFLKRLLRNDSPSGIPTSSVFIPPDDVNDEIEIQAFEESVRRFQQHRGFFHPHPGFGRLDRTTLEKLHAAHAAHHLSFLALAEN